jgi:hypothetical protein
MTNWEKQDMGGFWIPTVKGDDLIGVVKEIDTETQFGTQYTIERDSDKELLRTQSHAVLMNRMAKAKVGDHVKIVFLGEDLPKTKGRNPTKLYDVFIERPEKKV